MTDRISYLTVALEHDHRSDDIEGLMEAIRRLRGVASVMKGKPVGPDEWTARVRVRSEVLSGVMKQLDRENDDAK